MKNQNKPVAKIIGEDGNIFNLMSIAASALRNAGLHDQVAQMFEDVKSSDSYSEALIILMNYVEAK